MDAALAEHEKLDLARDLVQHLESGNEEQAINAIASLAGFRDSLLFQEVGRLTRELHNAINSFMADARIADIAQNEMPDAAERLKYVITMTEDAANTTLQAVEESLPLADKLLNDSQHLADQWRRFNDRQMTVDDFRNLSEELGRFLQATQGNSEALHGKLSEVLMAQGYQDLTGQIIRKVIDLVNDVESKLVQLVRLSGQAGQDGKEKELDKDKLKQAAREQDIVAEGPAVPGVDEDNRVHGQDDVDDLLSSLGF